MRALYAFLVLIALYQAVHQWQQRPYRQPPGQLVREEPRQIELPENTPSIVHGVFKLKPLAQYKIKARLIARESYYLDRGAKLSPIDLCVGWGKMSNTTILEELSFDQSGRFCLYRWEVAPPLPEELLKRSMANIHIIPANAAIEKVIKTFRSGQIISLEGQLVSVQHSNGEIWRSSLSREDSGSGACELMYVTLASVQSPTR